MGWLVVGGLIDGRLLLCLCGCLPTCLVLRVCLFAMYGKYVGVL